MGSSLFTYQTVPKIEVLQFYNWRWSFRLTARAKFLDSLHLIWMFEMVVFFFEYGVFRINLLSIHGMGNFWIAKMFGLRFFCESNTETKCQRVNLVWKVVANAFYFHIPGLSYVHLLLAKDWNQEPFVGARKSDRTEVMGECCGVLGNWGALRILWKITGFWVTTNFFLETRLLNPVEKPMEFSALAVWLNS